MQKEYVVRKSSESTLNITDAKIDSFRKIDQTSSTVRVYRDGRIGVAGALGDVNEGELEQRAIAKLDDAIPYVCNLKKGVKRRVVAKQISISEEKLIPSVRRLARKVAAACPRFLINGKAQYSKSFATYKNSEQTELEYENNDFQIFFQVKDKQSSNIADLYYSASTARYGKTVEDKIVEDISLLHEAFFTEPVTLPDGEYPMILDTYDVFGHIIKDFIAEYYVSGGSLLSGKLGEQVFDRNLSLFIDRNPSTNRCSAFFDAEGEIASGYRVPLIQNGLVKTILNTKNTAKLFNLPLAKSAGSAYDGVPSVSLPALYALPTHATVKDAVGSGRAIYVSITSGGDVTTEGTVGLPVMLAFLVEDGRIVGRVSNFNASGNIFDILGKNFIGVSKANLMSASQAEMLIAKMQLIN